MKSYSSPETFIQASSVMNVCDAFSRTKLVEMDVKATEKSYTYGINDNKTLIKTGDVEHSKLFRT